jgi:hypothetical protein
MAGGGVMESFFFNTIIGEQVNELLPSPVIKIIRERTQLKTPRPKWSRPFFVLKQ